LNDCKTPSSLVKIIEMHVELVEELKEFEGYNVNMWNCDRFIFIKKKCPFMIFINFVSSLHFITNFVIIIVFIILK